MERAERKFLPSFAELVDRLSVDQIKEMLRPDLTASVVDEMALICHDVDLIITEHAIPMTARFIRIFIALAQINLHIWILKDRMQAEPEDYQELLKTAHQLNGLRNQLKNMLVAEANGSGQAALHTNFNTDGLTGWTISL